MRKAEGGVKVKEKGKVCATCGDKGFHELLITCSQCKIISEHRYCTANRPSGFELWFCETCEESKQAMELPSKSVPLNKTKESAKVKFISTEEVASLALGSKTLVSSARGCLGASVSRTGDLLKRPSLTAQKKSPRPVKTTNLQGFPEKRTLHIPAPARFRSLGMDDEASHMLPKSHSKSILTIKSEDALATSHSVSIKSQLAGPDSRSDLHVSSPHKNDEHLMTTDKALACCKEEMMEGCSNVEFCAYPSKPFKAVEQKSDTKLPLSCDYGENSGPCAYIQHMESDIQGSGLSSTLLIFPNENEIQWRGQFVIKDLGVLTYEDIRAHFPGKISVKAYNATKTLPEKLQFSLINRLDIWPKIFQLDPPSCDDVAMYFLPSEFDRTKEKYIRLLERMNKRDLAMCCHLDGLELLIYSSKLLHDPQKLKMNLYLWGVFRHRRKLMQEVRVPERGNYAEAGMDIDMLGGNDIRKVEKPVAKPPVMQMDQLDGCGSASDQTELNNNKSSTALCKLEHNDEENISSVPPGFSKLRKEDSSYENERLVKSALKKPISRITSVIPPAFSRPLNRKLGSGSGSTGQNPIPQKYDKGHPASHTTREGTVISRLNTDKVSSGCHQVPLMDSGSSHRKDNGWAKESKLESSVKSISLVSAGYASPELSLQTGSTLLLFPESEGTVRNGDEPQNEGKNVDHGIGQHVQSVLPDLTLSRPQYVNDGRRWIPATSRERLKKDACGKDVRLTL